LNTAAQNAPIPSQPAQLRRQVHTITDRLSLANTYLINDSRMIIVDPGSELNVRLTLNYLQRFLQRAAADIDLIVLTQAHPEHAAGVAYLRRTYAIPVAASAAGRNFAAEQRGGRLMKLVDLWLEDVADLPYHPSWRVIASPGHSLESLCLYNPFTYELLAGDIVFTIEGAVPLLHGSTDRRQLEETVRTLRSLEVYYLYPGRGRTILSKDPFSRVSVAR
jgi:hydroxyacylglutathione hydrolase